MPWLPFPPYPNSALPPTFLPADRRRLSYPARPPDQPAFPVQCSPEKDALAYLPADEDLPGKTPDFACFPRLRQMPAPSCPRCPSTRSTPHFEAGMTAAIDRPSQPLALAPRSNFWPRFAAVQQRPAPDRRVTLTAPCLATSMGRREPLAPPTFYRPSHPAQAAIPCLFFLWLFPAPGTLLADRRHPPDFFRSSLSYTINRKVSPASMF